MSTYQCEGFIKEVKIANDGKVSFTLEPTAPYLFEKKESDGKVKKLLLFVDNPQKPDSAKIVGDKEESWFSAPLDKGDLSAMLIAKANRLKVRVVAELRSNKTDEQGHAGNGISSEDETSFMLSELKVL